MQAGQFGAPLFARLVICILLLVLPLTDARATTSVPVDVTCPVCENGFSGQAAMSSNNLGGQDRDFLVHARGTSVFLFSCWTCPRCLYTGFSDDFEPGAAPAEVIEAIRKGDVLQSPRPIDRELKNTTEIPAWVRYDLLVQTMRLIPRRDDEAIAWALLRAGWTQRFESLDLSALLDGESRADALYDAARPTDRKGDFLDALATAHSLEATAVRQAPEEVKAPDAVSLALALAATLFQSRGEAPDARRVLALLEHGELEDGLPEIAAGLRERLDRERDYLLQAIPLFAKQADSATQDEEQRMNLRYLVAELHRKVGHSDQALAAFEELRAANLDGLLGEWIAEARDKLSARAARPE